MNSSSDDDIAGQMSTTAAIPLIDGNRNNNNNNCRNNNCRNNTTSSTTRTTGTDPFCDPVAMLLLSPAIAQGYIILLTGGGRLGQSSHHIDYGDNNNNTSNSHSSENDDDEAIISLAFASLIEGNVIEACFGLTTMQHHQHQQQQQQQQQRQRHGQRLVDNIKHRLDNVAEIHDAVKRIAVMSYRDAFDVVIRFHAQVNSTYSCTRCFVYSRLIRNATTELNSVFQYLDEAIQQHCI